MTVAELIKEFEDRDIRLSVKGPDRLHVDAPKGTMTPELRTLLSSRKPEIIAFLSRAWNPSTGEIVQRLVFTRRGYLVPERLPERWRKLYEERAATLEFDGGQTREHAEAEALKEIEAAMSAAGERLVIDGKGEGERT